MLSLYIGYVSIGVQAIAVLTGLIRFQKLSTIQRYFLLMITLTLIVQLAGFPMASKYHNNYPLFHTEVIIEFCFLWFVFMRKIQSIIRPIIMYWILALYISYFVVITVFVDSIWEFPTYSRMLESILIIAFGIAYYAKVLKDLNVVKLYHSFMFWATTGFLLYFFANLLITLFGKLIISNNDSDLYNAIWSISASSGVLLYAILIVALLCHDNEDHQMEQKEWI